MGNDKYFEPDYQKLNKQAKRLNGNQGHAGELIERLFTRGKKREPLTYDPKLLNDLSALITTIKENIDWDQELPDASYIVFDTETTGLHPFKGDEIISIGAVVVEKGKILSKPRFYEMVNPGRPVSPQSEEITGLNNKMLNNKPDLVPVLFRFLQFTGSRILVAHNAPFDLAFINNRLGEAIGRRIVNPVIDTVLLTSALYYALGDYSLESLAPRFNISLEGRHNALGDAIIAASLFTSLLTELNSMGIRTLPELSHLFSEADPAKGYPLIF